MLLRPEGIAKRRHAFGRWLNPRVSAGYPASIDLSPNGAAYIPRMPPRWGSGSSCMRTPGLRPGLTSFGPPGLNCDDLARPIPGLPAGADLPPMKRDAFRRTLLCNPFGPELPILACASGSCFSVCVHRRARQHRGLNARSMFCRVRLRGRLGAW